MTRLRSFFTASRALLVGAIVGLGVVGQISCSTSPTTPTTTSSSSIASTSSVPSTTTTSVAPTTATAHYTGTITIVLPPPAPPVTSPIDLSLFFNLPRGAISFLQLGVASLTVNYEVEGGYNTGPGGFSGTIRGSIEGTPASGIFSGTMTANLANGCVASRNYEGPLTAASLNWTPGAEINNCNGASPLTFVATPQAAPTPVTTSLPTTTTSTTTSVPGTTTTSPTTSTSPSTVAATTTVPAAPTTTTTPAPGATTSSSTTTIAPPGPNSSTTTSSTSSSSTTSSSTVSSTTTSVAPCTYSAGINQSNFPYTGGPNGSLTLSVTTGANCVWYAFEGDQLDFGLINNSSPDTPRTGSMTLSYGITMNPHRSPQTGRLHVTPGSKSNPDFATFSVTIDANPTGPLP